MDKTFEQFLRDAFEKHGIIDFSLRAAAYPGYPVEIYLHPSNRDGDTTPPMIVDGNTLRRKE